MRARPSFTDYDIAREYYSFFCVPPRDLFHFLYGLSQDLPDPRVLDQITTVYPSFSDLLELCIDRNHF